MEDNEHSSRSDFEFLGKLGSGSFGTVFKVRRHADLQLYVIKTVRIGELSYKEQLEAINEVTLLARMDSPHIVRYFDSFVEDDILNIVMEFCNRGDLSTLLKQHKGKGIPTLPERKTWSLFLQIALGLYYVHRQKVLHRDMKAANVFLHKTESGEHVVKIGDLGVAKLMGTSTAFANTIVGTPYYLSPELCEDKPYNDKSDVWAAGVLLYECCMGCHPFEANNQCALILKIIKGKYEAIPEGAVSKTLSRLVRSLLTRDQDKRPSIADILSQKSVQEVALDIGITLPYDIPSALTSSSEYSSSREIDSQSSDVIRSSRHASVETNSPKIPPANIKRARSSSASTKHTNVQTNIGSNVNVNVNVHRGSAVIAKAGNVRGTRVRGPGGHGRNTQNLQRNISSGAMTRHVVPTTRISSSNSEPTLPPITSPHTHTSHENNIVIANSKTDENNTSNKKSNNSTINSVNSGPNWRAISVVNDKNISPRENNNKNIEGTSPRYSSVGGGLHSRGGSVSTPKKPSVNDLRQVMRSSSLGTSAESNTNKHISNTMHARQEENEKQEDDIYMQRTTRSSLHDTGQHSSRHVAETKEDEYLEEFSANSNSQTYADVDTYSRKSFKSDKIMRAHAGVISEGNESDEDWRDLNPNSNPSRPEILPEGEGGGYGYENIHEYIHENSHEYEQNCADNSGDFETNSEQIKPVWSIKSPPAHEYAGADINKHSEISPRSNSTYGSYTNSENESESDNIYESGRSKRHKRGRVQMELGVLKNMVNNVKKQCVARLGEEALEEVHCLIGQTAFNSGVEEPLDAKERLYEELSSYLVEHKHMSIVDACDSVFMVQRLLACEKLLEEFECTHCEDLDDSDAHLGSSGECLSDDSYSSTNNNSAGESKTRGDRIESFESSCEDVEPRHGRVFR